MNKEKYSMYKFISIIFSHPFTSAGFIIIVSNIINSSFLDMILSILCVSFLSILPPAVWAFKNKKSFFIEHRKEREPFLLVSSCILFLESILGKFFGLPLLFTVAFLYAVNTFALFLVNFRIKASVHIAGIAGPVTFLIICFSPLFSVFYLFTLPVALARFKLKAHTKKELILGFVTALFVTFFVSLLL